jgi:hypothetical protein
MRMRSPYPPRVGARSPGGATPRAAAVLIGAVLAVTTGILLPARTIAAADDAAWNSSVAEGQRTANGGCQVAFPNVSVPPGYAEVDRALDFDPATCTYMLLQSVKTVEEWGLSTRVMLPTSTSAGTSATATTACASLDRSADAGSWRLGPDPCWMHEIGGEVNGEAPSSAVDGSLIGFIWCPEDAVVSTSCDARTQNALPANSTVLAQVDATAAAYTAPPQTCMWDNGAAVTLHGFQGWTFGWSLEGETAGGSIGCTTSTSNTSGSFLAAGPTVDPCIGTTVNLSASYSITLGPAPVYGYSATGTAAGSFVGAPLACVATTFFERVVI